MKKILIKLIRIYQCLPTSLHKACRFYPTCSNYAIEAIETYGALKGSWMAFKRICRCNPWHKGDSIDLVPIPKKTKNDS